MSSPTLAELISLAVSTNKIEDHPFFKTMNIDLLRKQKDFIYAVDAWSHVLATLVQRTHYAERAVILKNLVDENPATGPSHVETFYQFLQQLEKLESVLESKATPAMDLKTLNFNHLHPGHPVRTFIVAMQTIATHASKHYAYAFFGMIEFTFITVSKQIGAFVQSVGQTKDPTFKVCHYDLHKDLDFQHAIDLFTLATKTESEECSRSGLVFGYACMFDLYTGLLDM